MAVAYDSAGTGSTSSVVGGASWSHTVGAAATAIIIGIGGKGAFVDYTTLTTHTVTVGGQPAGLLGIINTNNTVGYGWVELWGLINPPTGTQTVQVVENYSSTTPADIAANSVSYTGVTSFGTPVINSGSSTALTSGGIVATAGDMVVSVQGVYDTTLTGGTGGTIRDNQAGNINQTTILIEDAPSTGTNVTLTSTAAAAAYFGVVSVRLVGGTQHNVGGTLALNLPAAAAGSFVGNTYTAGATLALTTVPTAAGTPRSLGAPLRYVGRHPDTDGSICPASYVQAVNAATTVTPAWIDTQVQAASGSLVTDAWVTQQISHYLTENQVNDILSDPKTGYVPASAVGAASGVAQLVSGTGGALTVPAAVLPVLVTDNTANSYDAARNGQIFLGTSATQQAATNNIGEIPLANISVPDPGYPWIPLAFAYVRGYAGGTATGSRLFGNGNVGYLTVTVAGQTKPIYASGLCTDDPKPNYYVCLPAVNASFLQQAGSAAAVTQANQPPLTGPQVLELSACNWTVGTQAGAGYIFSGQGMFFHVLVFPAATQFSGGTP